MKTNKVFIIIFIHIFLIAVNWIVAIYIYSILKNDAKQINEMGQIRGGIQLVSKKFLINKISEADILQVDSLIEKATINNDEIFLDLQKNWSYFKSKITCKTSVCTNEVLNTSENLWELANALTFALQRESEKELNSFNYIFLLLIFDVILITIAIYLIYKLVNPALSQKQKELENYLSVIDKNIITSSTNLSGIITHASEAFSKISGYAKDELIGKNHNIVRHPDMKKETFQELWETISENKTWNGEIKNLKKDGNFYWVNASISPKLNEQGQTIGYTAIRQDITDKKIVEKLSVTDSLTQLYNRRKFDEVLEDELYRLNRHYKDTQDKIDDINIFLFSIDVDFFKQYNDTYGHDMGDKTLKAISNEFKSHANRHTDWAFRLGGEEFAILTISTDNIEQAMNYANKIRKSIESLHIEHSKSSVSKYITISVGISLENNTTKYDKDLLYKRSDIALYQAKASGRNRCELFE